MKVIILSIFTLCMCIFTFCESAPNELDAEYAAHMYVKQLLKSPGSAEFGRTRVYETSEGVFNYSGYVDSQNGFGAMIRNYFSCTVTISKDGKAKISDFSISER